MVELIMDRTTLLKALNHQNGPVPVDFGSTAVTGIHVSVVADLRKHFGLKTQPVKVIEPYQMLGEIDAELSQYLGVDTQGVFPSKNLFGFKNENWKPFTTPWGQEVLVPGEFNVLETERGFDIFPEGDTKAPASAYMPRVGYFFDTIIRQPELDENNLKAEDNLEEFTLLTTDDLAHFKTELTEARATGRGAVVTMGGTALGDIALVPAPFMKNPKGIRDISQWYMTIIEEPELVETIFEKQTDIALENLQKLNQTAGDLIDVIFICGTDFGTQSGTFCSPNTFNEVYLKHYQKINNWIHQNTQWKTFKHSCGAVAGFMDRFIDAGFDIINPVQFSASGMDPQDLKNRFGDQLVFWGGGVDTQKTLPFGTPADVRKEVGERLHILSENGGFVFDAVHNVQAKTPIANFIAMLETVQKFNRDHA
jgi:hypothetical protein